MSVSDLPAINAALNLTSTILLAIGYILVKRRALDAHKWTMIGALVSSGLFLTCYVIYHYAVGSVPYPHHDWTRPIYFAVLVPHVILAAAMVPFIILAVWYAYHGLYRKHTKVTSWLWPVWMFVSITGIIVYLMLYQL